MTNYVNCFKSTHILLLSLPDIWLSFTYASRCSCTSSALQQKHFPSLFLSFLFASFRILQVFESVPVLTTGAIRCNCIPRTRKPHPIQGYSTIFGDYIQLSRPCLSLLYISAFRKRLNHHFFHKLPVCILYRDAFWKLLPCSVSQFFQFLESFNNLSFIKGIITRCVQLDAPSCQ